MCFFCTMVWGHCLFFLTLLKYQITVWFRLFICLLLFSFSFGYCFVQGKNYLLYWSCIFKFPIRIWFVFLLHFVWHPCTLIFGVNEFLLMQLALKNPGHLPVSFWVPSACCGWRLFHRPREIENCPNAQQGEFFRSWTVTWLGISTCVSWSFPPWFPLGGKIFYFLIYLRFG